MMIVPDPEMIGIVATAIAARCAATPDRLVVFGLCGAQGSGKSTLAAALEGRLGAEGVGAATLSLDDLYLSRVKRFDMAREVHPLFVTRGPPGTHDIALGLGVIDALERGAPAALPRFDKARDEPKPQDEWPAAAARTQVLLLEGWCVGAQPQSDAALIEPVNPLEANEDRQGIWRRHANAALAGDYQQLFARLDLLVLLAAPGWDVVARWRAEQEAALGDAGNRVMKPDEIPRFIAHYERLTRHILAEMPARADLVIRLGPHRAMLGVDYKADPAA